MKRTSRNSLQPKQLAITVFVAVVLLLCLVFRNFLAGVVWRAASPLVANNPLSSIWAQFVSKANLQAQNDALRAEVASTSASLADRTLLYQENLSLKSRLGRDANVHTVLAGVIMRPPQVPYDTLMLDAGQSQGISVGDYVSAGGTTRIGEVDEVYPTAARVVLFSSPTETHQALIAETPNHPATPITLEGQGNDSLTAQVPADTGVAVGDAVVFPGIADGLTAFVSYVDSKKGESFEQIYLHLAANPEQLRFVEVILP